MVDFNRIKRVETTVPQIKVDAGLPVGNYVFQLTVLDQAGNKSIPVRVNLEVMRESVILDSRLVTPISPIRVDPVSPIRLNLNTD